MHKNNNGVAVKRLAKRTSQANRTRNLVTIIAIILTTFMISTVFSIGVSFAKNYKTMMIRDTGTTANMFLPRPSESQIEQINSVEGIDSTAERMNVGRAYVTREGDEEATRLSMLAYDKEGFEKHYIPAIDRVEGTYPEAIDEVMVSRATLDLLGIDNPKVGMEIELDTNINGVSETNKYKLTGWFTNFKKLNSGGYPVVLTSMALCDEYGLALQRNGGLEIEADRNYRAVYGELVDTVDLRISQEIETSFNTEDESSSTQAGAIIVIALMGLFIVLSGYLLIYNIIYISVSKDTRFYGMLKTLGTSPSQIRKIVRKQITKLAVIGIPVGLALGGMTSFIIVPAAMKIFQTNSGVYASLPGDISFNPLIFVGAALFALLTIIISCRKPAKVAGRISPVEAMKYTGVNTKKKIKNRKSTNGGKLHKLAYHNVFREKKRAMLVFASLFMGIITMLSVNGFLGSLDAKNFAEWYLPEDFTYQQIAGEQILTDKLVNQIKAVEGVEEVEAVEHYYTQVKYDEDTLKPVIDKGFRWAESNGSTYEEYIETLRNMEDYGSTSYALDSNRVKEYNENQKDESKEIDLERFERGETIILLGGKGYDEMIGKEITMTGEDGKSSMTRKVGGVMTSEEAGIGGSTYTIGAPSGIFASSKAYNKLFPDATIYYIRVNVDPDFEPAIKAELETLNSTLPADGSYVYECKTSEIEAFKTSMQTMNIMSGGISILLIIIGIINFINVMITGVYSRRRELAVMESVGMTKKQVSKMLTFEGVYYAIITTILTMTVGNGILYYLSQNINTIADYAQFQYPTVLVISIVVALFAICTIVPRIVYKTVSAESVTERLREAE